LDSPTNTQVELNNSVFCRASALGFKNASVIYNQHVFLVDFLKPALQNNKILAITIMKEMINSLKLSADIIKKIRQFFDGQGLCEVQTPQLLDYPTTDVYIDSIALQVNKDIGLKSKYLPWDNHK
jgi:lysyl-tRNA synthetase class II